jgi:hypothetical protein
MSLGIDYGHGRTNIDQTNGIRFGVISQNSVTQAWCDSAEADYGKPTCGECSNELVNYDSEKHGAYEGKGCTDYACESCELTVDSQYAFGDEPIGWNYEGEGYELVDCLDSDIMVLKSSFYTLAPFCSPCVPGAGDLDSACDDGAKTYCLGHDWFEDGKAPYRVFTVAGDVEVLP